MEAFLAGEKAEGEGEGINFISHLEYKPFQTTANTTNPYPSTSLAMRLFLWPTQ